MNKRPQTTTTPQAKKSHLSFRDRVRAELALRKWWTITRLAQEAKRPRETVSKVVNGSNRYPHLRERIEKLLGL